MSWKVSQNLRNVFAAQYGSVESYTQNGKTGHRICDNPDAMRALLAGCQHDASSFDVGIEWITGYNSEPTTKRARKHDLAFA
jgi:hypothetical protein